MFKEEEAHREVVALVETQMNDFASKFEKDFSMVSCPSSRTIPKNVWYLDSGASRHMTLAQELFSCLAEHVSRVQVKLCDDAMYLVTRVGTVMPYTV